MILKCNFCLLEGNLMEMAIFYRIVDNIMTVINVYCRNVFLFGYNINIKKIFVFKIKDKQKKCFNLNKTVL